MRYVALLRGINVGGHNPVRMSDLRSEFEAIGARDVATYIQSGNVVFTHAATRAVMARTLANAMDHVIALRTAGELAAIVDNVPFEGNVHVMFLPSKTPVTVTATPPARYLQRGRELYLDLPDGAGSSKLVARLGKLNGTMRNWRTVATLLDMCTTATS